MRKKLYALVDGTTGEQSITFKEFYSHYSTHQVDLEGDVNGDGVVDVNDVNLVINAILNKPHSGNVDVNGDGVVNVTDANIVINKLLKK